MKEWAGFYRICGIGDSCEILVVVQCTTTEISSDSCSPQFWGFMLLSNGMRRGCAAANAGAKAHSRLASNAGLKAGSSTLKSGSFTPLDADSSFLERLFSAEGDALVLVGGYRRVAGSATTLPGT